MKIIRYLHSSILVSDLEKAEYFYGTILGLEKVERNLNFSGVWYQLGDYQIHLIVDTNLTVNLANDQQLGRNYHIAFGVDNLAEMIERLESYDCRIQKSSSGRGACFTQDFDGNVIEITAVG